MSRYGSHSHSSRSGSERLQTSGEAEEIILRVGSPAHGGHCVARLDDDPAGRVVFVRHALPGEVVRAVLTEKSAKIWRADAVEVLSASPDRVRSVWREAGPGGVGCAVVPERHGKHPAPLGTMYQADDAQGHVGYTSLRHDPPQERVLHSLAQRVGVL